MSYSAYTKAFAAFKAASVADEELTGADLLGSEREVPKFAHAPGLLVMNEDDFIQYIWTYCAARDMVKPGERLLRHFYREQKLLNRPKKLREATARQAAQRAQLQRMQEHQQRMQAQVERQLGGARR